jgi:hypothetical protein
MIRDDEGGCGVSYWPSVSDLFMTLFIIAIALIAVVLFVFLPGKPTEGPFESLDVCNQRYNRLKQELDVCKRRRDERGHEVEQSSRQLVEAQRRVADLTKALADAEKRLGDAEKEAQRCKQRLGSPLVDPDCKIPIIPIEPKGNFFASGSAEVSVAFARDLRDGEFQKIAAEIIRRNQVERSRVDTLEIIGHTDGLPFKQAGNLDRCLPLVFDGRTEIGRCRAGSNNDLGLMRAMAIKAAWRHFVARHEERAQLELIEVRTYSAGQTLPIDPVHFQTEDPRARRIEMRLTRLR